MIWNFEESIRSRSLYKALALKYVIFQALTYHKIVTPEKLRIWVRRDEVVTWKISTNEIEIELMRLEKLKLINWKKELNEIKISEDGLKYYNSGVLTTQVISLLIIHY